MDLMQDTTLEDPHNESTDSNEEIVSVQDIPKNQHKRKRFLPHFPKKTKKKDITNHKYKYKSTNTIQEEKKFSKINLLFFSKIKDEPKYLTYEPEPKTQDADATNENGRNIAQNVTSNSTNLENDHLTEVSKDKWKSLNGLNQQQNKRFKAYSSFAVWK